ncbi:MAG: hypothetical protein ISN29_09445 [Gammaproteobacteria bacterium AqS3]|nr:hypothetical protein [Gammaproteobacteria bacterium AqS3]
MNAVSQENPHQSHSGHNRRRAPSAHRLKNLFSPGVSAPPRMHRRALAAALLVIAVIAIAGQSPTAAAQQPRPAAECVTLPNQQGTLAGTVTNSCSNTGEGQVRFVGRSTTTNNTPVSAARNVSAGSTTNTGNNLNACIEYSDSDTQRDSGYAACPALDLNDAASYPLTDTDSVTLRFADKLDAGFRDLPAELTLEEGASGEFTVRLTTSPEEDTSNANNANVTVTIAQPAASTGVTIDTDSVTTGSQTTLTFTGANWHTAQAVSITTTADDDAVVPADLTLSLTASGGGSGDYSYAGVNGSVILKQTERNTDELVLSPTDLDVNRDGSNTFTVRLGSRPSGNVEVTLTQPASATGVTADTNTGAANNQTTLDFTTTDWNDAQTVTVSATGTAPIGDNAATISLAASGASEYAGVTGSVTIDVEARLPSAYEISPTELTVAEGTNATFDVRLRRPPSAEVRVQVTDSSNNPDVTVDTDTSQPGFQNTLTFSAGNWNRDQTVTVSVAQDDDIDDDSASISLFASSDDSGFSDLRGRVAVTITDDGTLSLVLSAASLSVNEGGSQTFTVHLVVQPSASVTVRLTRQPGNTDVTVDETSLTFTTANWQTPQSVTVSAGHDDDLSNDTARIDLAASGGGYAGVTGSVAVSVTDDDALKLVLSGTSLSVNEGGSQIFTVQLASQPSADVTVTLRQPSNTEVTVDTDARTASNQTELTFTAADWNTPQSVTVSAAHDDDSSDDSATVSLSAAGGGFSGASASVAVSVADDEAPRLILSAASLRVDEGGSKMFTVGLTIQPTATVTVTLTQPSNTEVTLDTDAGTAGSQNRLMFTSANWRTPQGVTVSAAHDDDSSDDSAGIALSAAGGNYAGLTASVAVTVSDDEALRLTLTPDALTVAEGGSKTFTVRPGLAPTGSVTVTLTQPSNTDVMLDADANSTGDQTMLTFTTANWQTPQTVTVRADHDDDEINDTAVIALSAAGGGYDGIDASLTVSVTDDDDARLDMERETVKLLLAEAIGGVLSSTQEAIGLRWGAERSGRSATLAGRSVALDRSALQDLAAGFAGAAGSGQQSRFAGDRFGAERHSADWLGGVPLDAGRPLRSAGERTPPSRQSALLGGFSYALSPELGRVTGWSVWGRTDTRGFSGSLDDGEYDGSQSSFWLGLDHRGDGGALSGLAYSSSSAEADYTMGEDAGLLETDLSAVMPYIELAGDNGATSRMLIGLGSGEATLTQTDRTKGSTDLTMYLLALVGSWPAAEFASSTLSWSGDLGFGALEPDDVPAAPALDGLGAERLRIRAGLQLMHEGFGSSWTATPKLALMLRQDSGDGATGSGVELTAGMQVISTSGRLSVDVNVRSLLSHGAEDYSDSGSSLQLRLSTRTDGSGLAFSVGPHWGSAEGELLRGAGALGAQRQTGRQTGRGVMADIGYGLRALGGLLTPYSEYRHTGGSGGSTRQVAGVRFSDSDTLEFSLFSERLMQPRGESRSHLALELQRRF